jgi:hypothetical protein
VARRRPGSKCGFICKRKVSFFLFFLKSKCGKYGVRHRPRKPAAEASAERLPPACALTICECCPSGAVQVHEPFPPSPVCILYNRASPPLGHSSVRKAATRTEHALDSSPVPLLPVRRPAASRSTRPLSALRPPDRAGRRSSFSGEFPAFLCSACASVGPVVRACGVGVIPVPGTDGFGVVFGSFCAFVSAETGDRQKWLQKRSRLSCDPLQFTVCLVPYQIRLVSLERRQRWETASGHTPENGVGPTELAAVILGN